MLDTLETVHGRALRSAPTPLAYIVKRFWAVTQVVEGRERPVKPPIDLIRSGETVDTLYVRVNHGRWAVDCPTKDCPGADLASDTDRRFLCVVCGAGVFAVAWPSDDERVRIEAAMAPRPVENRNWAAGDPLDDEEQLTGAWVLFGALAGASR